MDFNLFLILPIAGLFGYAAQRYVEYFADNFNRTLQQSYQQTYQECYVEVIGSQITLKADYQWLKPLSNKGLRCLPLVFGLVAWLLYSLQSQYQQPDLLVVMWWLYALALLTAITLADYHYRLISTLMCQHLLLLALFGSWQNIAFVSLEQSMQSLFIALPLMILFYLGSKWLYRKEVFGEGDCWLITALAAFYPYQQLPLLLLFASGFGLLSTLLYWIKSSSEKANLRTLELPFAPSLALSALLLAVIM